MPLGRAGTNWNVPWMKNRHRVGTQSAPTLSAVERWRASFPGTLLLDYYLGTEYLHVVVFARVPAEPGCAADSQPSRNPRPPR